MKNITSNFIPLHHLCPPSVESRGTPSQQPSWTSYRKHLRPYNPQNKRNLSLHYPHKPILETSSWNHTFKSPAIHTSLNVSPSIHPSMELHLECLLHSWINLCISSWKSSSNNISILNYHLDIPLKYFSFTSLLISLLLVFVNLPFTPPSQHIFYHIFYHPYT